MAEDVEREEGGRGRGRRRIGGSKREVEEDNEFEEKDDGKDGENEE